MTVEIVAKVAASSTLSVINTIVVQNENTIGPLTNIGNDKGLTTLSFAVGAPPTLHATIKADVNGVPSAPGGSIIVDTDLIFVVGQLTLCTASR
jgi:hypothetical protein